MRNLCKIIKWPSSVLWGSTQKWLNGCFRIKRLQKRKRFRDNLHYFQLGFEFRLNGHVPVFEQLRYRTLNGRKLGDGLLGEIQIAIARDYEESDSFLPHSHVDALGPLFNGRDFFPTDLSFIHDILEFEVVLKRFLFAETSLI